MSETDNTKGQTVYRVIEALLNSTDHPIPAESAIEITRTVLTAYRRWLTVNEPIRGLLIEHTDHIIASLPIGDE